MVEMSRAERDRARSRLIVGIEQHSEEMPPSTRVGLTWTSQVDLDFKAPARFSGLGPVLSTLLASRGLLDSSVSIGTKIPQQVMVRW